ncbi:MAG: DUF763 domain-containing protein [Candidatus Omnitrophica bacterium]|jgi:hypothetical protein|nr:DUF763 domain-containing protein [Candidatus Omnitrophota bacterium]MDD5079344.1 DUF763 domain-containing protein [Candidatus Omnitrophota bacterium]
MIQRGVATFTLDSGKCPRWLFERMVSLGREMAWVIIQEDGPDEFIRRISDPVWFQSLGTVLAFDWNASGLTTILTAALKEAIRGHEREMGVFICGGKGKTSRKTPDEIQDWGGVLSLSQPRVDGLVYNSRMAAKVDSALIQDGFQIYHHSFFFSRNGAWAVVQQGMNTSNLTARRYHWYSEKITDLVCEPHSGIISQVRTPSLDLTARKSADTRKTSTGLVQGGYSKLIKEIEVIRRHSSDLSKMVSVQSAGVRTTLLRLENKEFTRHPVLTEDFSKSKYLEKILAKVCDVKPESYEQLLAQQGVGPKTMRALSLVSEVVYGARPSYEDPARYSFAHGGKDATPFPVDRETYDNSIEFFSRMVRKARLSFYQKKAMLSRLTG